MTVDSIFWSIGVIQFREVFFALAGTFVNIKPQTTAYEGDFSFVMHLSALAVSNSVRFYPGWLAFPYLQLIFILRGVSRCLFLLSIVRHCVSPVYSIICASIQTGSIRTVDE